MRREAGGTALSRFLATWERLHAAGSEATPTPPRPTKKKQKVKRSQERGAAEEKREERDGGSESACEEDDIVEDFNFTSSDSD